MTLHGWAQSKLIELLGTSGERPVYRCPRCGTECVIVHEGEPNKETKGRVRVRIVAGVRTTLPIPDDCDEELARQVMDG